MGKSVPKGIKSKARVLMAQQPETFGGEFEKNQEGIRSFRLPFSKWTTNVMAGFITRHQKRIVQAQEKEKKAKEAKESVMKDAPGIEKAKKPRVKKTKEETAAEETTVE
ncbi:MAG: hypothetical protein AABY11_02830 [archaeon]